MRTRLEWNQFTKYRRLLFFNPPSTGLRGYDQKAETDDGNFVHWHPKRNASRLFSCQLDVSCGRRLENDYYNRFVLTAFHKRSCVFTGAPAIRVLGVRCTWPDRYSGITVAEVHLLRGSAHLCNVPNMSVRHLRTLSPTSSSPLQKLTFAVRGGGSSEGFAFFTCRYRGSVYFRCWLSLGVNFTGV